MLVPILSNIQTSQIKGTSHREFTNKISFISTQIYHLESNQIFCCLKLEKATLNVLDFLKWFTPTQNIIKNYRIAKNAHSNFVTNLNDLLNIKYYRRFSG